MIVADKLFLGSTAVDRVYLGSELVWPAKAPPVPAGPSIDVASAGVLSARFKGFSNPRLGNAGVLSARRKGFSNPRVGNAGALVVRKWIAP